jgi:hypothetical protein
MTVRPADSAAVPKTQPSTTSAPAETNQAAQTRQAEAPRETPKAAAVPDNFAARSGGGLGIRIPSPGDIWNGITNIFDKVKNVASDVWNGAKDLAQKGADALNKLVTEDIPAYARQVKDAALDVVRNAGGQAGIDFLNGVGKAREKLGIDPPARGLKPEEITELRKVYGDSVDYSQVRVHDNVKDGLVGSNRAMTLGNDIYMPGDRTSDSSYAATLVHEMGHVWQGQNGGPDYATKAIEAQLTGPGGGYDWEAGVKAGQSWGQLNPEQQAELIQNAYESGYFNSPGQTFTYNGTDYTDYVRSAVDQMRNRQGAP